MAANPVVAQKQNALSAVRLGRFRMTMLSPRQTHDPPRQQRGEAVTLEQIRAALPTHIMLTPGVHRWRKGDEVYVLSREGRKLLAAWEPKLTRDKFEVDLHAARRPIPPHILDNQAFWVMFDTLAEIPAYGVGGWLLELERGITDFGDIRVLIHNVRGLFYGHSRRFRTKDDAENAIEFLGGQNRIIKELEVGRLYDKWLLEQIESGG